MAFMFNVYRLLASVRSDEVNLGQFTHTDTFGRELSHQGDLIRLDDIKRLVDSQLHVLLDFMTKNLFFGRAIPLECTLEFEMERLVDNLQNRSPGYNFLEDPRNGFDKFRHAYGRWLLSDPKRAEKYVYVHNGELVWKPVAAFELLEACQGLRNIIAPSIAPTFGSMMRGSEFARMTLRNGPGGIRNLMLNYHVLTFVSLQDKTSHQHGKDLFIPHAPTREWAQALIYNLVIFRPFEEYLVSFLMDGEVLHRYRYQLWPGLKETMTSETFGDLMGQVTGQYLHKCIKPRLWRGLVTAFARFLPDARAFELSKQFFVDTANMHSSDTAVKSYGRMMGDPSGSDHRVTRGCIQASLDWQKHVNIGQVWKNESSTARDGNRSSTKKKGEEERSERKGTKER
jgi:hypothetical protein